MRAPLEASDRTLDGLTVAITGASAGLGYFTAENLARQGAEVIILARNQTRAEHTLAALRSVAATPARWIPLDLSDLESIRSAADALTALPTLDVLINNAGVLTSAQRALTHDGHELMFGTNHLGHFALTALTLPVLDRAEHARIVHLGSISHEFFELDFDDLQNERFGSFRAYGRSKLAVMTFGFELDKRLREGDNPTRSLVAHPGWSIDELTPQRAGITVPGRLPSFARGPLRIVAQGKDAGAEPIVSAAVSPLAEGGDYWGPAGWRQLKGSPALVATKMRARDRAVADRLWQESERLTGVRFPLTV